MAVLAILVDAEQVRAAVKRRTQASLSPHPDVPNGRHPLIIEIWRVSRGRMEPGGIDLHSWSERAGHGLGMVLSGRAGELAAKVGRVARQVSETGSRTLGSFNEVLVTVPNVVAVGQHIRFPSLVLGMYTDSALSRLGDRLFGFGFNKQMAHIARSGFEHFEVREPDGRRLFQAKLLPSSNTLRPTEGSVAALRTCLARPLLGQHGGSGVVSYLDRFFEESHVRVRGARGSLVIGDGFINGIEPGTYDIKPATLGHPWGAFSAANVPVKLSFPKALLTTQAPLGKC
jgi:hypothetical protein